MRRAHTGSMGPSFAYAPPSARTLSLLAELGDGGGVASTRLGKATVVAYLGGTAPEGADSCADAGRALGVTRMVQAGAEGALEDVGQVGPAGQPHA